MKTFIFHGEGHTLGNALRTLIMKKYMILNYFFVWHLSIFLRHHSPDVSFCGYTIPHPSENKLHLRIETIEMSAVDALREGLEQLQSLSDHVLETFEVIMFQYGAFFY